MTSFGHVRIGMLRLVSTTFLFACFLSGCSGADLVNPNDPTETKIIVGAIHQGSPESDGTLPSFLQEDGAKSFQNDLGVVIRLEEAHVHWGTVTFISNPDLEGCFTQAMQPITVDKTQNLLTPDGSRLMLEEFSPEVSAFCEYEIALSPQQEAAAHSENASADLLGASLLIQGTWEKENEIHPFLIALSESVLVQGVFNTVRPDGRVTRHPLHTHGSPLETESQNLSEPQNLEVTFKLTYDHWFDGITFEEDTPELEQKLITNIGQNLTHHPTPHE